jgi:hypothetical protein
MCAPAMNFANVKMAPLVVTCQRNQSEQRSRIEIIGTILLKITKEDCVYGLGHLAHKMLRDRS